MLKTLNTESTGFSRRNIMKLSAMGAISAIIFGFSSLGAATTDGPPKPGNVMTPDQALARLKQGNARYVEGSAKRHDFVAERPSLALGQNPFASIVSCADSRIAPEFAFDTGRGDLFVVRVAGNFVDTNGLASLEFATAVLKSPLIVVLGHESCGAISSTITAVQKGTKFPGHIPSLVKALTPAVQQAEKMKGDLLENSTRENVVLNVEKLKNATPIIHEAVLSGKVKIVGGVYNLHTGKIDWLN